MSKLADELRKKFKSPGEAIAALGLDEACLDSSKENDMAAKSPTNFANHALQLTALAVRPLLAKDAKIDLMPIFKDVTSKNFDPKAIKLAMDSALDGKLAKDADPESVGKVLNSIAQTKPDVADESVSEPQHKAMEAAAHGESNLGIPPGVGKEFAQADKGKTFDAEGFKSFLKGKGMGDEDIAKACDMLPRPALDADESPEEKLKREEEEKKARDASMEEDKRKRDAEDKARDDVMKGMVTKGAMDEALKATAEATAKTVRDTERGIRLALDEVKPWVGALSPTLAFDSKVDVYRHSATMLGIANAKTMHADALLPVIMAQPKPGAKPSPGAEVIAQDAAATDDFTKMYGDAGRIAVGA